MAENISVEVKGLRETLSKLDRVSVRMRRTVARRSVTAAARVIAVQARANARPRKQTGTLGRAIFSHYSPKRSRIDKLAVALVRARSGKREANRSSKKGLRLASRDAYYAGWVEFGHRIVDKFKGRYTDYKIRGRGRLTGLAMRRREALKTGRKVRAYPFLEPAYLSKRQAALDEMARVMAEGLKESAR